MSDSLLAKRVAEILLLCAAATDAAITTAPKLLMWASLAIVIGALSVRKRWPIPAFACTVVALFVSGATIATLIALYTVANRYGNRLLLVTFGVVATIGYIWTPIQFEGSPLDISGTAVPDVIIVVVYAAMTAGAPILLGRLVHTSAQLRERLLDIEEVREHERRLDAQAVLATERNQLAREMHDVVSHQVSLIAVQAAALQVSSSDPGARDTAGTLRRLAVNTLEELRHMVNLLRASGGKTSELHPQPTMTDLERLVTASGIAASLHISAPPDLDPAIQRTVYRTVQESLTNVRKHAPGSTALVDISHNGTELNVKVTNTRATRTTLALPSARHGLVGLHERAALLGGTLSTGATEDGGFQLQLQLPLIGRTLSTQHAPKD